MDPNWLTQVHEACGDLRDGARTLCSIARSLERVGMGPLAEQLAEIAIAIDKDQCVVMNAISAMLSEQVAEGRRAIHDVFLAALEQAGG